MWSLFSLHKTQNIFVLINVSDPQVELTPEQRSLYPELAKLHDDIIRLKEAETQLKHEIFYSNAGADLTNSASGQIGYSY